MLTGEMAAEMKFIKKLSINMLKSLFMRSARSSASRQKFLSMFKWIANACASVCECIKLERYN